MSAEPLLLLGVPHPLQDESHAPTSPNLDVAPLPLPALFPVQLTTEAMNRIKNCEPLMRVIKSLKESNLEFITIDSRTMVTDHPLAAIRWVSKPPAGRELCQLNGVSSQVFRICIASELVSWQLWSGSRRVQCFQVSVELWLRTQGHPISHCWIITAQMVKSACLRAALSSACFTPPQSVVGE